MWKLIGDLSEALHIGTDEIYRAAIKRIGGNREIVCVREEAADKLCEIWQSRGLGWVTDTVPSKLDGCVNVILYYGSSVYDTKQMSVLIDRIVQDCEAVGIDTKTPDQIANLLNQWEVNSGEVENHKELS